jgi:sterol desaturase/sphingolipid hydroxylase (fatty acid hydroxylase superfamily)
MLLSKAAYYADFVVYPLLLLSLGAVLVWAGTPQMYVVWIVACFIGIVGYSLLEYGLHRVVLHHIPPFRRMHDLHHANPTAMVGTPTWLSVALIVGSVLLPLWWQFGVTVACGLTFGLILGYLWYVLLHHAVHRWPSREGSYLHWAKRRHNQHHGSRQPCNFGVTNPWWDQIFGSVWSR